MSSALTRTNGHFSQNTAQYQLSVREFFSTIAWNGKPNREPWAQSTRASETSPEALDMHLSVNEFFGNFPWDGKPNIAVPVEPLVVQPDLPLSEDDLTLEGFADLF